MSESDVILANLRGLNAEETVRKLVSEKPAEAVVHLLMDTVFILIPDQIGHIVDGGRKKVAGLFICWAASAKFSRS